MSGIIDFVKEVVQGVFFILIAFGALYAFFSLVSPSERRKRREKKETERREREKRWDLQKKYNMKSCAYGWMHLSGLPIAETAKCDIWECENCLVFYSGRPYVLDYSKLMNIEFLTRSEVRKHYTDDVTGAIAGGLLFGVPGALFCGGTKEITETESSYFVSVTYKSGKEIKNLLFNVTGTEYPAKNFVKKIRKYINYSDRSETRL